MPTSDSQLVHHFLESSARCLPNKTAIVHDDHRLTYKEINRQANALALWLRNVGVKPGARIALLFDNSIEYVISYYGILKTGAVVVSLNTALKKDPLVYLLNEIKPVMMIASHRFERLLIRMDFSRLPMTRLAIHNPRLDWTASPMRAAALQDILKTESSGKDPSTPIDPNSLASIIYTSGSTGRPKGVMLSHRNIVSNVNAICQYLALSANDVQMVILPFFYVMGKSLLNSHFAVGGTVVVNNKFAYPAAVIKQLIRENVTGFSGVPSTFAYLLYRSPLRKMAPQLTSLRYCSQAGGHMSNHLKQELRKVLPDWTQIFIMYGATEASARLTYLEPEYFWSKMGSIGKSIPTVNIKVLDENGHILPPNHVGELVAEGPNIMQGYYQDPESTNRVLNHHGYHTGDLGYYDQDGFLYVTGRKDNILKVGGHRINPQEIEDVLLSSGLLAEVAILGQPDKLLGTCLIALATPIDAGCSLESIYQFCGSNFPPYKRPKSIKFISRLPKQASGKIDKLQCALLLEESIN